MASFESREQFSVVMQFQFAARELERVRGFKSFQELALLAHILQRQGFSIRSI